jgi:hypothetical protein
MGYVDTSQVCQDLVRQAEDAWQDEDLGKAEQLLLLAYEFAKTRFGLDSSEVGLILLRLGLVCHKMGKTRLANAYLSETDRVLLFFHESANETSTTSGGASKAC